MCCGGTATELGLRKNARSLSSAVLYAEVVEHAQVSAFEHTDRGEELRDGSIKRVVVVWRKGIFCGGTRFV
jgi:hypothetical protein